MKNKIPRQLNHLHLKICAWFWRTETATFSRCQKIDKPRNTVKNLTPRLVCESVCGFFYLLNILQVCKGNRK